jgi:hypothetical protein
LRSFVTAFTFAVYPKEGSLSKKLNPNLQESKRQFEE